MVYTANWVIIYPTTYEGNQKQLLTIGCYFSWKNALLIHLRELANAAILTGVDAKPRDLFRREPPEIFVNEHAEHVNFGKSKQTDPFFHPWD